jgi:2-polyprenyl-6-methoxyphenol hydroxylase-like FAD-dependent oxidoreductase
MAELPVLIAGAGIGGLTLACALARKGIACRVFEKAKQLRPIGAGITMQGNAMLAFRAIGLEGAVRDAGAAPTRLDIRRSDGGLLARVDLAAVEQALGATTIAIHRGDLHAVLHAAAGDVVTLGAEATGYRLDGDTVTLLLAGREVQGCALVGADGLHSAIRTQVLGETKLRYAGYTSWRGITAANVAATLPPEMPGGEALGRGERFGWVPVGEGRVYWFGVALASAGEHDDDSLAMVKRRFGSWGVPAAILLDATDGAGVLRTDIHDREPVTKWGDGRVTLLGDAAHPMTPNLGQGGGQAVEDAVVLASCLGLPETDIVQALRRYEATRVERANRMVREARMLGSLFQANGAVTSRLRNTLFRATSGLATGRAIRMMRDGLVVEVR